MPNFAEHPLVTSTWLAEHLADANLRIVDARWRGESKDTPGTARSRVLFLAGHIPGAVPLDWHYDLSHTVDAIRDLLLPPEPFAAAMEAAGIGDDTMVVAYAETDHSGPARLWWALRYYGHSQVAVLDGGLNGWVSEGRHLETSVFVPGASRARFTPRPQSQWLAGIVILLSSLIVTVGFVLFGIATWRAGVLPRWAALIVVLSAWFGIAAIFSQVIFSAAAIVFSIGNAWLGYAVWADRGQGQ